MLPERFWVYKEKSNFTKKYFICKEKYGAVKKVN